MYDNLLLLPFGKSWFEHIQKNKQILAKSSEIGTWFKCFFGLSYLPPAEITDGFTGLSSIASTTMYTDFTDYTLENYILPDSDLLSVLWVIIPNNNPKTICN